MARFLREKSQIGNALKFKLDLIMAGKKEEAMKDGVTVQQLINMQKELNNCKPKHCKNLKAKVDVLNSNRSMMSETMVNSNGEKIDDCQIVRLQNYKTY